MHARAPSTNMDAQIIEQSNQVVELRASRARIHQPAGATARLNLSGGTERWLEDDVSISWEFTAAVDGIYAVEVELQTDFFGEWDSGYSLHASCSGQHISERFNLPENYVPKLCS